MPEAKSFYGTTRLDEQHEDIFPGSPMALVALFTAVLQERFSGSNAIGLPWYWAEDPKPEASEQNTPDAPRKIYIASAYTEFPEARDFKPAIYVDKEDTQFLKLWIGQRGHVHTPTMTEVFVAHALVPMSFECVSNVRGESAGLGDHVCMFLLADIPHIRAAFSIHDITPPILGKTGVRRASSSDVETWVTTISFQTQIKFMWRSSPIAPRLQEIAARLTAGGNSIDVTINKTRKA